MEDLSIAFLVEFFKYEFDSITFMLLIFVVHEHVLFQRIILEFYSQYMEKKYAFSINT